MALPEVDKVMYSFKIKTAHSPPFPKDGCLIFFDEFLCIIKFYSNEVLS